MIESPKVAEPCLLSEYEEKPTSWRLSERDAELATKLEKRFNIDKLEDGIRIKANSWVGHVTFDAFDLVIRPKFAQLDASPLATLLAYAFNWQNLEIAGQQISSEAYFAEILILGLLDEARNIQRRGPFQQYKKERRDLSVLRGKIDMTTWLRRGGIPSESMPCVFYRRSLDNILNQTLCAGLRRGAALARTPKLKSECHFLADTFALSVTERTLDHRMLADAARSLNRLNAHYENAIQIIQLLYDGSGGFTHGERRAERIPGFFFDMNTLFERVLAKFLRENLPDSEYLVIYNTGCQVFTGFYDVGENIITINDGRIWQARPDFIIDEVGSQKRIVLDAKYYHISPGGEPLEQLCLYALAFSNHPKQTPDRRATILFPDNSKTAQETEKPWNVALRRYDQKIANNKDLDNAMCVVTAKPINMLKLVELIDTGTSEEKQRFALGLIEPSH